MILALWLVPEDNTEGVAQKLATDYETQAIHLACRLNDLGLFPEVLWDCLPGNIKSQRCFPLVL